LFLPVQQRVELAAQLLTRLEALSEAEIDPPFGFKWLHRPEYPTDPITIGADHKEAAGTAHRRMRHFKT